MWTLLTPHHHLPTADPGPRPASLSLILTGSPCASRGCHDSLLRPQEEGALYTVKCSGRTTLRELLAAEVVPLLALLRLALGWAGGSRIDYLTHEKGRVCPTGWSVGITRDPLSSGSVLGVQKRSPLREWSGVSTPKQTKSCYSEGMTLGQLPKSQRLSLTARPQLGHHLQGG